MIKGQKNKFFFCLEMPDRLFRFASKSSGMTRAAWDENRAMAGF
jgi:hypothetical protein